VFRFKRDGKKREEKGNRESKTGDMDKENDERDAKVLMKARGEDETSVICTRNKRY
jgi:hypothetical protein